MALNFPDSPALNEIYTDSTSGFSYQWNGTVWISYTTSATSNTVREIDDISGSFDGSQDTFPVSISGNSVTVLTPEQLIVSLGGVIQNPNQDYIISGSDIIFTTPPTSGLDFFATLIGTSFAVGFTTSGGNVYYRQLYNPIGVQTTFNFADGYTPGYFEIYKNGVKLLSTVDYTAIDGLTFDLNPPGQIGDEIEAIGYKVEYVGILTSGAVGGGTDNVFYENGQTVNYSYTITTGKNAISAGPITIGVGATVNIPDGSVWSIV
jgi:hypothetical protein